MNFNQFWFVRLKTGKFYMENFSDPGLAPGLNWKYYMVMYFKKKLSSYEIIIKIDLKTSNLMIEIFHPGLAKKPAEIYFLKYFWNFHWNPMLE